MYKVNKSNSISIVARSSLCSACGACSVACPKGAVKIDESVIGRQFASTNESCINCGLCLKICPSIHNEAHSLSDDCLLGHIDSIFIGRATNEQYFKNSQSGGGVTAILTYLFEAGEIDGALVCQAEPGDNPHGKPVIVESPADLFQTQKSFYGQVAMLLGLKGADKYKSLAVVGLPCQLAAIDNIKSVTNKINISYKIGLICDRSLCNGILPTFKKYASITTPYSITWREKCLDGHTNDYAHAPVILKTISGETKIIPSSTRMALKSLFTPPRCWICPDKLNPSADIVFGDPWGISGSDMQKGESLIIIRSSLGHSLFEAAKNNGYLINLRQINSEDVINGQHIHERKSQVTNYVAAMKLTHLFRLNGSYLLEQRYSHISPKELLLSLRRVLQFRKLESGSKQQMINAAINKLN